MSDPTKLTQDDLAAMLDESDADIAAGRLVSGEAVVAKLRSVVEAMEAARRMQPRRGARPQ
jgi:hypothetical protein